LAAAPWQKGRVPGLKQVDGFQRAGHVAHSATHWHRIQQFLSALASSSSGWRSVWPGHIEDARAADWQ